MENPFFSRFELTRVALAEQSDPRPPEAGLAWLREQADSLYLFGCGGCAYGIQERLSGFDIRGYLDNDPAKQGTVTHCLPVFAPEAALPRIREENALVIISMARQRHADEAAAQCAGFGVKILDWWRYWLRFGQKDRLSELALDENAIRRYGLWEEEESRRIYRNLVRFRATLDPANAPPVTEPQYFIKEIPREAYRNFVDCGAFDGDTLRVFLSECSDDFDSYHAFEPISEPWERLRRRTEGDARIKVYQAGVSDRARKARMSNRDTSSQLNENGEIEIDVVSLDETLGNAPVSFIKMDIEGEELAALRGAERIIRRDRPVLAICVYHQPDHLWRIPNWIDGLGLGYKLVLRQHLRFTAETVCYALPH